MDPRIWSSGSIGKKTTPRKCITHVHCNNMCIEDQATFSQADLSDHAQEAGAPYAPCMSDESGTRWHG